MCEIIETPEQSESEGENEVSNENPTQLDFYPSGYIISFISLHNPEEDSAVVSMGGNIFIDVSTNQVYNSYDEWLSTLPSYANADIGITESIMTPYVVESL